MLARLLIYKIGLMDGKLVVVGMEVAVLVLMMVRVELMSYD